MAVFLLYVILSSMMMIMSIEGCYKCHKYHPHFITNIIINNNNNNNNNNINNNDISNEMIKMIIWYKSAISPLMPKNCRFLPTCSSYGIEALEKYGSAKGLILITWRIIRCNPTGGYGYDPVQWPPVNYFYPLYNNNNK